jgi:tetratricopeptide (TPR) repeat protein/predicted Ser/Thr protein kinase
VTEHIGIYRMERPIGRGGMGEVFLAWDDRLERRVAIKRIRRDSGLSAEQRERFRREARLAARLSHAAVVQIYDLVTGDADDAIVMEYVEGRTLAERLAEGPLEIGEALRLAQEIAQGLAAAHAAGLIHRDLKAANIIVTPAGHAKILDFGLARPVIRRSDEDPLTRQGFMIGTFHAMSPEQARGEELDERSDLFSLGILLYEMLTGKEPFRGADPVETLKRIVQEPPPDPRTLRPDLSLQVESLLLRLLAKERENRPGTAKEVATALERLRTGFGSGPLLRSGEASVSDLPTAHIEQKPSASLLPRKGAPPSSLVGPIGQRPRRLWTAAVALLILGAVGAAFLTRERPPTKPLRVAVSPIEVFPLDDERLALAGSGVLTAAISGLTALEGLVAIAPEEAARGGRSPVEMAMATAADEVLTSRIQREGNLARVTLRRLGSDGRVLWTDSLQVPMNAELPEAVAICLQKKAYPDHDLRPGVPEHDVRDQDYTAFLEIKQRVDSGVVPPGPELARLEEIVRSSPRFLEAWLLAARLAHHLFLSRGEVADLDRATEMARQAKQLSPEDPRPLRLELNIELAANRFEKAEKILTELEGLTPGNPEILVLRARMADRQGRLDEAAGLWAAAVEQVPSWQNLLWLADIEVRRGRIAEARQGIGKILQQAPDNPYALEALGHIELLYGDLARAEEIYEGCITTSPQQCLNNLGQARVFSGRFEEAADAYRRSLSLAPEHVFTLVSLAEVEAELGRTHEAKALYQRALDRLEENEKATQLGPTAAMLKARCLAELDRPREAVELAQAQLRRNSEDPYLLQQSALIHSLAGEYTTAHNNAEAALDKGFPLRWFTGSAFRWFRESPEGRSRFTVLQGS